MPLTTSKPNILLAGCLAFAASWGATTDASNGLGPCQAAARQAAHQTGVPEAVLLAISIAETGRSKAGSLQPWPWAMNTGGESHWFNSADDLYLAAEAVLRDGKTNVDLGCFQLNYRWHAAGFASLDQMIDPVENARYAAGFLADLYAETGDWALAAAAYHSRTPEYAAQYQARFETILASLSDETAADAAFQDSIEPIAPRINQFPLLQAGARGSTGSLVPRGTSVRRLIGGS